MRGQGLTPKQKAFADYYIELGNASQAALKAGYKYRQSGDDNMSNPVVTAYIAERMAKIDAERVASSDEVIKFYTAVMRGEIKDQFGLEAALSERLKAADSLMKRYSVSDERQRATMDRLDALFKEFRDAVDKEAG